MYDHANVIAVESDWRNGDLVHRLGLELPSGKRIDCPDLGAKPGDMVVVMTENEFMAWKTKGSE